MKRFIKYFLIFCLPVIFLLVAYVVVDPYKVLWHYDNYYDNLVGPNINRNMVSTYNYLNKKDQYHYDSFIFGNSRSMFYRLDDWKKHLDPSSVCYHFSDYGGSVGGIYYKVKLIDRCGEKLKNALIIIDPNLISKTEQNDMLGIMPPVLKGYSNVFEFHKQFLTSWFNYKFLKKYIKYHITKKYTSDLKDVLLEGKNNPYYNPVTNEKPRHYQDSLLANGAYFNEERIRVFDGKQYNDSVSPALLNDERRSMLSEMKDIFNKHHTSYRIVVSPLYDQIKLNPDDYQCLCEIFGKDHIFDFSGKSKWSADYHNYYEESHYLPSVSAEIVDSVYQ